MIVSTRNMKIQIHLIFGLILFGGCFTDLIAQFNSIPGKPNSIAIHGDSNCFVNWASTGIAYPGLRQVNVPDSGYASVGTINSAFGKHRKNGVISLGDGGSAVLGFSQPIINGPGFDFAVFENAFNDSFLELAHVEVSEDGLRYFRFPSISLSQVSNQTEPFGTTYPDSIYNLAGRFRMPYGTPFDLSDFNDTPNFPKQINYVKIVDVIGSIQPNYGSRDARGNLINDPWPTNFASSGFDLDAVGVINQLPLNSISDFVSNPTIQFKNPITAFEPLTLSFISHNQLKYGSKPVQLEIYDALGNQVYSASTLPSASTLDMFSICVNPNLKPGLYFLQLIWEPENSPQIYKILFQ